MGDLTGTVCSLTKAFLFKPAGGELPENHSQRMNFCPSGEEEVNKERRASSFSSTNPNSAERIKMSLKSVRLKKLFELQQLVWLNDRQLILLYSIHINLIIHMSNTHTSDKLHGL